jgi:adenine-specific DNA-methyltransferase
MQKLKTHSPDITESNIGRIADLFPTVITEQLDDDGNPVRAIDFDLLRQELSDHVVEGPQERYQLDWPGKRAALFAANAPIAKTLRPVREESVNFDTTKNLFIEGDNLDALKLLQESYLGKVKLIYIDPPYNTGNDFVYRDDYAETPAEYLTRSGQVDSEGARLIANTESNGRFHSDWLSMMYPRLKLARNLLTQDGLMLISIDDGEVASLRLMADEIFGHDNFIGTLIHQRAKGGGNARHLVRGHDYILAIARDISAVTPLRRDKVVQGKVEVIDGVPHLIDDDVLRKTFGKYEKGTERRCLYEEIVQYKGESKKTEIDAELSAGTLFLMPWTGGHIVARRTPIAEAKSKLYSIVKVLSEEGSKDLESLGMDGLFSYPKPRRLMQQLVQAATPGHGDIVMDLFSGSGSMIHGLFDQVIADDVARRFIAMQLPEDLRVSVESASGAAKAVLEHAIKFTEEIGARATVAEIGKERIRRAGAQAVDGSAAAGQSIDVGFRALRVDSTNSVDVLRTPDLLEQDQLGLFTGNLKDDRTEEDLLFQVLLDWGLELTTPLSVEHLAGHDVFVVEEGALIASFADKVSSDLVLQVARREPLRAVFRDSGFATDTDRINAEQVFAEISPSTNVKVI